MNNSFMEITKTLRMRSVLLMLALCTMGAHAQVDPITIDVELSRARVYVGDEVTYQVVVRGIGNPPTPEIDFPSSVRAQSRGRSSQSFTTMRVINGKRRSVTDRKFTYQYLLTAVGVGDIVIPAPKLVVNGQTHTGKSVSFESVFPVESDSDDFEMSIERTNLYLNETVEIECTWWIGAKTTEFSFASSYIPESFVFRGMELQAGKAQRVGFKINNQQLVGVLLTDTHRGVQMDKLVFRFSITPTEIGVFDLGPMRSVFTRHAGTGGSFRAYIEAEPVVVSVEHVPTENKPDGYSDAIGVYTLGVSASNTSVNVGDPINLSLLISGKEPMMGIDDAPDLSKIDGFAGQFKVSSEGWRETLPRQSGMRFYETTIRALNEHVNQIPSIELPSFDPALQEYQVFISSPIDLIVHPVDEITLSDAIIVGDPHPSKFWPEIEHAELTKAMPRLWAHSDSDTMLIRSSGLTPESLFTTPRFVIAASGPSLFLCSYLIVLVRRSSTPNARCMRRAWKQSRSIDRHGDHAAAFRIYLGASLGINEDAVTSQDAHRLSINEDDACSIARCIETDEQLGYIGDADAASPRSEIRSGLLMDVHRQVKRAGGWV